MKKIIAILSIFAVLLTSCGGDKKESIKQETAIAVKVSGVSENNNSQFVTASGKIEAENSANSFWEADCCLNKFTKRS